MFRKNLKINGRLKSEWISGVSLPLDRSAFDEYTTLTIIFQFLVNQAKQATTDGCESLPQCVLEARCLCVNVISVN